jgi:hypothetical protein
MSSLKSLDKFISKIDRERVYVLPYSSNARIAADNGGYPITEKSLLEQNIKFEILQHNWSFISNKDKEDVITALTEHFWNSSTLSQKNKFINLATNANRIINIRINSEMRDRMSRITNPQNTDNELVNEFFGGISVNIYPV